MWLEDENNLKKLIQFKPNELASLIENVYKKFPKSHYKKESLNRIFYRIFVDYGYDNLDKLKFIQNINLGSGLIFGYTKDLGNKKSPQRHHNSHRNNQSQVMYQHQTDFPQINLNFICLPYRIFFHSYFLPHISLLFSVPNIIN